MFLERFLAFSGEEVSPRRYKLLRRNMTIIIALATIAEIDAVKETYLNVARIMGATRLQTYLT